jgi:hypothetical protein
MIRFVCNVPFAKYEFARFTCGIYDATEEEAERLRKSKFFEHSFFELKDDNDAKNDNKQKVIDYENMDWNSLKRVASENGIKTHKKKKVDIIKELVKLKD